MKYYDTIVEVLNYCDNNHSNVSASIYESGDNEDEYILVIDDNKSADIIKALLKERLEDKIPEEDKRDYDSFYLDYATDEHWTYSDEGFMCSECYKWFHYDISGASGYANYFVGDGYILCPECIKKEPDEYINTLTNDHTHANTIFTNQELIDMGYEKLNMYAYENGWYGREDKPEEILKEMQETYPEKDFIFSIKKNYNPWETEFDIFGKDREVA